MKDKEKKELLKKFWLEIKEHQKKWREQPISWHHGLEEGFKDGFNTAIANGHTDEEVYGYG